MPRRGERFALPPRIVGDRHRQRMQHCHPTWRRVFQCAAGAELQEFHGHTVFLPGDADALAEVPNHGRGVAAAAQPGDGGQARIVPARDVAALDEFAEEPRGHHCVFQVEPRELYLRRVEVDVHMVEHPIVEFAVVLELQGAERVRHPLQGIAQAVREVVHRIDAPSVAGAVVRRVANAIEHRVAHHEVRRGHVDLGAQHLLAIAELAGAHAAEQRQVLLHGAATPRARFAGFAERAAGGGDLRRALAIDIRPAPFDELLGEAV